ncbi:hypothetical protein BD414DRAFT_256642 [Trametes punicea]|nr:hypothetical protein BD414DRAFT_256642 [Trametes punicea]
MYGAVLRAKFCRRPFVLEARKVRVLEAVPPDCARISRRHAVALEHLAYGRLEGSGLWEDRPGWRVVNDREIDGSPIPIRQLVLRPPLSSLNVAISIPRRAPGRVIRRKHRQFPADGVPVCGWHRPGSRVASISRSISTPYSFPHLPHLRRRKGSAVERLHRSAGR